MKTEVLQEFVVIAKHLNFTVAAKELFVSQPRLSTHIKALEKELGFELFIRANDGLHLSAAGSVFLESAQRTLSVLQEGRRKAQEASTEKTPVAMQGLLMDSPYHKALTRVKEPAFVFVDTSEEMTSFTALEKGIFDVGNHFDYTGIKQLEDEAKAAGFDFICVGQDRLTVTVMKSHPLASKGSLTREDLRGLKVMITSGVYYDSWRLLVERTIGEDLELEFSLNQLRSMYNLAFLDMGDKSHVCSSSVINACFANRDDVVSFDTIDGAQILFPDGFMFRKGDEQARALVLAIKEQLG